LIGAGANKYKEKCMNIRDIAKLAGVTHTTVSKILNKKGSISEETIKKVMSIIKDNDYYPSEAARRTSLGRGNEIAFISTRYASQFISRVIEGLEDRSYGTGKYANTLAIYSTRGTQDIKKETLIRILHGRLAEAVIMLFVTPDEGMVSAYKKAGIPIILLENRLKGAYSISVDNISGAYDATTMLLKNGRKKIGLIRGETGFEEVGPTPMDREKGYKKSLSDAGLEFNRSLVEEVRNYLFEEGKIALDKLLSREKKLDAVFCAAGDMCAMGVMERAKELKLKIPGDIAVIGFDDLEAASRVMPALTTVRQPVYEMGTKAFELAVDTAEGRLKKPVNIVIKPQLIIRESAV
jgi:LacI family transcriptional regulator